MIRTSLLLLLCLPVAAVAAAPKEEKPVVLKEGDKAPKFEAKTDEDKAWKSSDHVGKKVVVVYFYPKDMTPGCTKQACNYRDMQKEFAGKDVEIVGVSRDTVESHAKFKKAENLNFTLLADPEGKIADAFGVPPLPKIEPVLDSRWTFVIDRDGKIAYKNEDVKFDKDTATVLKVIEKLKAAKS